METLDIFLIIVICGFAMSGLWFGFVHTLGSFIGTIVAAFVASRYYVIIADWLIQLTNWDDNFTRVLVFITTFVIINRLIGFAFWSAEKFIKLVTRLPYIRSIDCFLGIFIGVLEGILTLGMAIYFIERYPISDWAMNHLASSQVAPHLVNAAGVLLPFLPDALKALNSTVDYVEQIAG